MYVPAAFQESDPDTLWTFIAQHSFGLLTSHVAGELFATHVPLLSARDAGAGGELRGHLARANPQWRDIDGQPVLAVFSGPHAYVSPSWYEAEDVVPTWNYVAVHVHGTCHVLDGAATARIVAETVTTYERPRERPWSIDAQSLFFERMIQQVVGFRIEVSRIEGKWKLNQNHPAERRAKVARQLLNSTDTASQAIGRMMSDALPEGR